MTPRPVAVAIAAVLTLAACSGSPGSSPGPEDQSSKFDEIAGMEVQQDQLPISPEDQTLIRKAEYRLANACMADLGFPPSTGVEQYSVPEPPLYLSPKDLRRSGYQFDFAADAESFLAANGSGGPVSPTQGMSPAEAEEYGTALNGKPDGPTVALPAAEGSMSTGTEGCQADARKELYGSLLNYLRYDRAISATTSGPIAEQLGRSKEYRDHLETWQSCMEAAGHPMADESFDYGVRGLRQQQTTQLANGGQPVSETDAKAVAVADADCQETSGLYEVRERLLPDAEDALTKRLGLETTEVVAFQNALLAKAKSIR